MRSTRASLLYRLRDSADATAWSEFYELYAPVLVRYARVRGLSGADAEEVRDASLEVVARRMKSFAYDPERGHFKSWLFTIARRKVVDLYRLRRPDRLATAELELLADGGVTPDRQWEEEWRAEHLRFALERARMRVSGRTWEVFERLLAGEPVVTICEQLAVNQNQVYKARGRVLAAVRDVLARLDPAAET